MSSSRPKLSCANASIPDTSRLSTTFAYAPGASSMMVIPKKTPGTTISAITASTRNMLVIFGLWVLFTSQVYTG